ncbi:unnamed protein product, partial [Vitis vinifera]
MSSSNSPCAACKIRRQKCTQECVLAPYFPPDQPQKFVNVHKVFGASNVTKLLNELNAANREDAVNSLAYEAEARLRDPVYGCVGLISVLQQRLKQVQSDLLAAKKELAAYIGPSAMLPFIQHVETATRASASAPAAASDPKTTSTAATTVTSTAARSWKRGGQKRGPLLLNLAAHSFNNLSFMGIFTLCVSYLWLMLVHMKVSECLILAFLNCYNAMLHE